ncbi:MAG: FIST C-terminal domain-containing protein [Candidatus Omnitrophica bacterium]|nr:FIST C-terminal domain-containing protein [Candidatus Omnitrophota bacterium]
MTDLSDPVQATKSVAEQVAGQLKDSPADAAFWFASPLYKADWGAHVRHIRQALGSPLLIGCTGGGIIGPDRELEGAPAMSLVAAHLPRVKLHPFSIKPDDLEQTEAGFWIEKLGVADTEQPIGILLPEPFSCDVMTLIPLLTRLYPKLPLIGGLASGANQRGGNRIFLNDEVMEEGAVGMLMTGDIALQTVVAQGCRPIGRTFIITKAEGNTLLELAGVPAMEALQQLFHTLPPQDQKLAQHALLIGIVMDERKAKFDRGDFLIRNLAGMDPESGALVVGDQIQVGQTVQFQVRDAESSREDLKTVLKEGGASPKTAAGGLLFSCLGRGQDLYGEPNHDIKIIQAAIGGKPVGGFFCNGEIGPVSGRNFVHGFTSSLGLFKPRTT